MVESKQPLFQCQLTPLQTVLLLCKSDFCIWSLLFKHKLLFTAHNRPAIWQTCRKVQGTAGREEEVSQDLGQIPTTPLKMTKTSAQLCMVTSLVFEAGPKRDVQCLQKEAQQCFTTFSLLPPLLLRPGLLPNPGAASFPHL